MERGMRIYFDENGQVILNTGEATGEVLPYPVHIQVSYLDFPVGYMADDFRRVKDYHIDVASGEVVIDELWPIEMDKDAYIAQLESEVNALRVIIEG